MELLKVALVFLGGIVVLAVVAKRLMRAVGVPCQFCDNQKLSRFDQLPALRQQSVLEYFRVHEHREPDTSGVFACLQCMTIHDDFSGEKRSADVDFVDVPVRGISIAIARTFCKVCNRLMQGCDPDNDNIHCPRCDTQYHWQKFGDTGFRFLMPPSGVKLLERCRDVGGIA